MSQFGLYIVRDGGVQEPCTESDCPLMVRLRLGPNEEIAKIFVMEVSHAEEMKISAEVRGHVMYTHMHKQLLLSKLSLMPSLCVPPSKKQSGEQSPWAYSLKVVMTNEIARSVIIT